MSNNTAPQQKQIEATMMGLLKKLEKLAPHPNQPNYSGPTLVQINSDIKPPADYDGMLGSMMLDSMLGMAFGEVANMNAGNTTEALSTYIQDRQPSPPYKLGQKTAISGAFNTGASTGHMMNAYLADMPKRKAIETSLAHYQRLIYSLQKQAQLYSHYAA